jgi:hypothetical protein
VKRPENPCGRDCKKRTVGCAVGCKDWAEYVAARDAFYIWLHNEKVDVQAEVSKAIKRKIKRGKDGLKW